MPKKTDRLRGVTFGFPRRAFGFACLAVLLIAVDSPGATYYWNRNSVLTNDKDFSKSYNWTSAGNGTGTYPLSSTDDDFTNDALGSAWTFRDADNDAGTGSYSLTTSADQLTLSGRGADVWGSSNQYVAVYRKDIHGNFDVTVRVVSQTNTDPYAKAGIMVANDVANLGDGGYFTVSVTPSHGVNFNYDQAAPTGEMDAGVELGPGSYPIHLRLVKNGLNVSAFYRTSTSSAWTQVGSAQTSLGTRLKSHVALFSTSHNTGATCTAVFDDFTGGGAISAAGLDLSMNGSTLTAGATFGSNDLSLNSLDFTNYTGTLDFGGQNGLFATYYDNMDFTGTSVSRVDSMVSVDWGTGSPAAGLGADQWSVRWEGYVQPEFSETYTFYCKSDDGCRMWVNHTLVVDQWVNQGTTEVTGSPTLPLTAGQKYPVLVEMYDDGGGAWSQIKWSSASQAKQVIPKRRLYAGRMAITGTGTCLNMNNGTITASDGWLEFNAAAGTQTIVPRSGQTLPNILHSGAGTLKIATNALSTIGFFQSAGTFDFNSLNVATVASGTNRGDFQVWNGGPSSFSNLGGRTITVAGHTGITGSNGSLVNLNPGSGWSLTASGRVTVDYAALGNCNANGSVAGLAFKTTDAGSNTNWTIKQGTFYWNRNDVLTGNANANRIYNWTSNADGTGYRPEAAESDKFGSRTLGANWLWKDLDNDEHSGSFALSGGQLLMSGRGGDIYTGTNQFVTLYRTDLMATGDAFDVTVKVVTQSNSDAWGKAGLIMANSLSNLSGGGYAFMAVTPGNNFSFQADVTGNIGEIDGGSSGGTLTFPCWIRLVRNGNNVSGYYRTSQSSAWTQSNATVAPQGIASGVASQVGLFVCSHNTGATMSVVFDDFEGGGYMSATDNDLSFNGTGGASDADAVLQGNQEAKSIDFTNFTGSFDFNVYNLTLNTGNAKFVNGMTLVTNQGGGLLFTGTSGTQIFTPKPGAAYNALSKSGAGTLQISTNGYIGSTVTQTGGSIDWGNGLSHTVSGIATSGSGAMTMGTSSFTIPSGNVDLSGLGTLNVSAGASMTFSAASGTQVFTPKGAGSTHPAIVKSGGGALQLSTNGLVARDLAINGGTFDFAGKSVTVNNGGNFAVNNGTSTTIANLGGATLTVAGTTTFGGTAGNLLDLNPASAWFLNSAGAVTANYASVANSDASGSGAVAVASNSVNQGGNVKWNFPVTDYSAWSYSTQITFNTTGTGANISNNLANFPLLVRLDSNNFIFPQADPAGKDIRFVDPDGNTLAYEIERWDAVLKKAEVWVMVPQIDANSNRDHIKMHWGNPSASAASSGSAVFNSGMNWAAVWHLKQNGAQPSFADASAASNTGAGQGAANGDTATANIGFGYRLNGSSKYLTSSIRYNNQNTFTIGCWFSTRTSSGGKLIGWGSGQTGTSGSFDRHIWMDNNGKLNFGAWPGFASTLSTPSSYNDGEWHQVTGRLGPSGQYLFVDGTLIASNANTSGETTNGYWRAGYDNLSGWTPSPASSYFNGTLDEITVNHGELSADWIKFAYYNQKRNNSILSYANSALGTWPYSAKVYINTTASGADVAGDVSNFPLLVRLTQGNFDFAQAKSDGGDLRFADSAGALLPYELERFDAANKVAEAWVLIPTVKGKNNAQWFRMYWGKPAATSLSSPKSVFTAPNGYLGVWHLDEDGNTATDGYADATSMAGHGTGVSMANTDDVAAVIGNGQGLNGSGKAISIPAGGKEIKLANKSFSIGCWSKRNSTGTSQFLAGQGAVAAADSALHFGYRNTDFFTFDFYSDGLDSKSANTSTAWQYWVATFDAATKSQKLYLNGRLDNGRTANSGFLNGGELFLGRKKYSTDYFNGVIDEFNITGTVLSADFIKLNYETTKPGSAVVAIGARPSDFARSIRFNFNTTASGANVPGNVANIPILVRLNPSNFDFSAATDAATDLQFIDKDGTYLYHEVVDWDKANSTANVWVRVPQVDGNSAADFITLYYGCAACTAGPYAVSDSVFSMYRAAYHLEGANESRGIDASKYKNHLGYTNDVAVSAGLTTSLAPYFDGSTGSAGSYAYVNDPAGGELDVGTGDFTLMGWIKTGYTPQAGVWTTPYGKQNNQNPRYGYGIILNPAGGNGGKAYFEIWNNGAQKTTPNSGSALNDGAWHHVAGKKTSAAIELFVDGASQGSTAHALGTLDNAIPFTVGGDNVGSRFQGYVNDVSLAAAAFSSDFIKLSYENQKPGSALFSSTTFSTASFQNSKVFRLNTTASGANVPGDVYDFPLLLRITGPAICDAVQAGAPDIRFLDGDGVTWLDYQIERWSQSLDSAEVWVKVPRIRGNSASGSITMYYGQAAGAAVPDGQCASCVFSAANGFAGAYHLAGNVTDAGAAYNGTDNASGDVGGIIGRGRSFNGGTGYVSIPRPVQDNFTIGFWMNTGSTGLSGAQWYNGSGMVDGDVGGNANDFGVSLNGSNVSFGTGNSDASIKPADVVNSGAWQYITATRNRAAGTTALYINGTQKAAGTSNTLSLSAPANLNFGRMQNGGNYYTGNLDEIQISSVVRDSSWNLLAYQNQRRDAAPLFNNATADFQKSRKYVFNTTRTGADVMGDVTDYPLLVRITDANGGILDQVQGSGAGIPPDIRFLDGDGKTWLDYQVERWDRSLDSAEVWVRVPRVDGNSDHDFITLYYQQASGTAVADGQCAACVFDTTNGFASAWHLNNSLSDATAYGNNGTNQGSADGEGVASSGRSFSGTAQYATFGNGNGLKYISNAMTVEAWLRTSQASGGGFKSIIRHDGHFTPLQISGTAPYGMTTAWAPGQNSQGWTWDGAFNTGGWVHFVSQYDKEAGFKVYKNGVPYWSFAATGALTTGGTTNFTMGGTETGLELFTGKLDEVRVYSAVKDSNWFKLDYETQRRAGNLFWNNRAGPDNTVTLTATANAPGNIALSWNTPVSDSSNADSIGIWVRYDRYPDSANAPAASAGSATHVANLAKTDTGYTYPATYPGTYYFALAVRNTGGKWSPFTASSSDTANLGAFYYGDTVYVDSAIGNDSYTCAQAQNPATPKLTVTSAVSNCSAADTLVVRVMPGTYASDNSFTKNAGALKAHIVSFDNNSRAILNGAGSVTENSRTWNYTVAVNSNITLRQMDVRAAANGHVGVYLRQSSDSITLDGNRIYGVPGNVYDTAIGICNTASEYLLIMNNVIYRPAVYGIEVHSDNRTNIINNVFYGSGGSSKAVYMNLSALNEKFNITNNIFYDWNYGIQTADANGEIGNVSNNLFFLVTSGQEVVGETDAAMLVKDPLFANTVIGNPNGFKLLPGSPAIDAGISALSSGTGAYTSIAADDFFGSARTIGPARDIGIYEGTGYTPDPAGEFDSLVSTSTATTVTVYNSKWKVVFDKAKGGGIGGFYDQSAPSTNLLASGTVLFEDRIASTSASSQTSIAPMLQEQTKARVVVRQRFAYSASLDVNIFYTLYPSGHIFVQAEYVNLSSGSLSPGPVDYTLRVNAAVSAFSNKAKDGFAYLTTSSRDAALSAIRPLDDGAPAAEAWTGSATQGASGNAVFNTAALAALPRYYKRYHHFLIYIGDANLDFAKASVLNADVSNPSVLSASSGSLIHERSWQDQLGGHWTFDEGGGTVARDKSVNFSNNGSITGARYVSGKINSALAFASTDVVAVPDAYPLQAITNHTYMFWLKPDFASMGSDAYVISKGQNSTDGWSARRNTSANTIRFRVGAGYVDSPALTDGAWNHIAVVIEEGNILSMYVNGVFQAVSSSAATPAVNSSALRIGENDAVAAANRFTGDIDDVRIYLANVPIADIQAIYNRGYSQRYGIYRLRADNNNRMAALVNGGAAQTRVQPAFQIDNWFGPATPKFVYLNGARLSPNTDFSSGLLAASSAEAGGPDYGNKLILQLNRNLAGADQLLFVDDDDSTGYMGSASAMKGLTISATANDRIAIKNFADTVFGGPTSGQWYLELDLNGWTTNTASRVVDSGFGGVNVWKAAAINPNVAISGSTNLAPIDPNQGRQLATMKFSNTGPNLMYAGGSGYLGPANLTYTVHDSSSARLSLTMTNISLSSTVGTATLSKRWTIYPNGRIIGSWVLSSLSANLDEPDLDIQCRYNSSPTAAFGAAYMDNNARAGWYGGDLAFHSLVGGVLSVKNNNGVYTGDAATRNADNSTYNGNGGGQDYRRGRLMMTTALYNAGIGNITTNFFVDVGKDFTDSATADSIARDLQTPAVLTAITGSRTTNDALDFNADNFAEGDGAYTYAAASGIAHFKFANAVASFSPAFRIGSWTQGVIPEVVILDNQTLSRGYGYNAYLKTPTDEIILQFNRTLAPGNHVIYVSHKSGLAVTLHSFTARGGEGVDTLEWTTESEFENLGYNVYRRPAPAEPNRAPADGEKAAGAGIANALANAARAQSAAAAKPASGDTSLDTVPSRHLTPEELSALGYVRINPKIIPGAKGGSSGITQTYRYIDRTAGSGKAYEYILESVDFNGTREHYGPRTARPANPLATELYGNYPNPFNPVTTLRFSLKDKLKVSLIVYDSRGRAVRTLIRPDKAMAPGKYRLIWDARDEMGFEVPSGQYYYRFTAERYVKTRKMLLVK
jgi:hypothetical protein